MNQFTFDGFNGDIPQIINASEHHMALLFLLDTSGSMGVRIPGTKTTPIEELTNAINRFKAEVCSDEHTKDILDVAIIEFNNTYKVIQEFSPIEYLNPVELTAYGQTYISEALEVAVDMVTERSRFYRRSGAEPYKPWIVLISDGEPFDSVDDISKRGKRSFFGGVPPWRRRFKANRKRKIHTNVRRLVLRCYV